eukprot:CAMPEP_0175972230 /NCGR_PEP_ID=MMETSP0108-20121206/42105_1 /TAXON_ID=195067 ORGANISM="Goniomonas pacifica, Strain CCMP1869" /NCGR_SAMPLE_ID=MMETSP0108 /ASSEMBLY_ACC=CAM_ASM_000204 /LENGTH=117 /DNA_ID=CAMNT_0017301507 /DNA_START=1 /DNA_END=354 /DNA_ORIENTATION=+
MRDALQYGVPSIVLQAATPLAERKEISLLNRGHCHFLVVQKTDTLMAIPRSTDGTSQFDALSKTLDAEELSILVRTKLGIDLDDARAEYSNMLGNLSDGARSDGEPIDSTVPLRSKL